MLFKPNVYLAIDNKRKIALGIVRGKGVRGSYTENCGFAVAIDKMSTMYRETTEEKTNSRHFWTDTMDVELILKTVDEMYGLSEEYPDQVFDVTSTKYAVVLHSATGEQFQTLRTFFSDNELTLLDTELSRASKSNTNLVYCTSNNDPNNLDKINQGKKDVVNLELILKTIDEMYSLSDKYPDQLFDVTSTENEVVLHSIAGEQFHILRSSFSDKELSILDTELSKASERNMNLIYRTTILDYDEDSEDDLDDILEDSGSAENEMDILQRLDEMERENKKLCCMHNNTKKKIQKYMEMWTDNTVKEIKDYKYAIGTHLDKVNRKVDELSGNLEELDIIRHNTPIGGNSQDNTAMFFDLRDRCFVCEKLRLQTQQAYSNAAVTRFKYRKNKRSRNLIYQRDNNKSNLISEFRKRKCTDAITEADQKRQKLDRRKSELLYV